jgi:hypothetical protein
MVCLVFFLPCEGEGGGYATCVCWLSLLTYMGGEQCGTYLRSLAIRLFQGILLTIWPFTFSSRITLCCPSKNSSWYVRSGIFILAPTSSSSTSSSGSYTFLPSTTLSSSSATRAGGGPTATSSAGAGARTAMDQLGWGVLGLIGVLAMW